MTHGALFNGIGGFQLAAQWAGIENVFHCEIDDFCNLIVTKRFPNSVKYGDITTTSFKSWKGSIDFISGGFPCQPYSKAGKRNGHSDKRALSDQFIRSIDEIRPKFFIGENVPNLLNFSYTEICAQMEEIGYVVQGFSIPSSAVGGFSNRDRIWITGIEKNTFNSNLDSIGSHREEKYRYWADKWRIEFRNNEICQPGSLVSKGIRAGTNTRVFRDINGIPNRVDRLRAIGNAIDPRVAYKIFKALKSFINYERI